MAINQPMSLGYLILNARYHKGEHAEILLAAYQGAPRVPTITLRSADTQEPLMTVTVRMDCHGFPPANRCTFVKNNGDNAGVLEDLIKYGLMEPTGKWIQADHVKIPEVRLLLDEETWKRFEETFPTAQ